MAYDRVEVYIENSSGGGWTKSIGWTSLTLSRSKDALTGQLNVTYFFGYVPTSPVVVDAARGREILVYVGGYLAFTGIIDKRTGQGSNTDMGGGARNVSIGPNEYSVSLSARGKTKRLVDSSHNIRANMNGSNSREILEKLVEPWGVTLDWQAEAQPQNKYRFRDGARVIDEIARLGLENCHYIYETRTGDLRVTDGATTLRGDPLVLGQNILTFSAEQSENAAVSGIRVKGQKTEDTAWGEDAVLPMVKEFTTQEMTLGNCPVVVQHYGNATEASLERRGMYEGNKRMQQSKSISVDVFSVEARVPWDLGQVHRVVVPCEGIDNDMECTELSYSCTPTELKTTLTLAPLPSSATTTSGGAFPDLPSENLDSIPSSQSAFTPGYPSPWTAGSWTVMQIPIISSIAQALGDLTNGVFGGLGALGTTGEGDPRPPERLS